MPCLDSCEEAIAFMFALRFLLPTLWVLRRLGRLLAQVSLALWKLSGGQPDG